MSRSMGNTLADSLQLGLGYVDRLSAGVEQANCARFATPGGQVVESNHPAFILGHLSLYPGRITDQLGRTELTVAVPDGFEEVFSKTAQCVDDPDGSIYPQLELIRETFDKGYAAALQALREAEDGQFAAPNPIGGPATEKFPTLGSMHGFYVGGHVMMHLGQWSAWRRMQGLAAA